MNELLSAFGIDWRLLVINSINFGLMLFALWYFLYGPVTRMLETRRQKIAEGLRDAEEARVKLYEIEKTKHEMLAKVGKEADHVLAQARASAIQKERELIAEGEAAAATLFKEAELAARDLKEKAITESKQEVAKLIVLGMEKALRGKHT